MSHKVEKKAFRFSHNFFVFFCILIGVVAVVLAVAEAMAFADTSLWRRATSSAILVFAALIAFAASLPCAFRCQSTSSWLGGTSLCVLGSGVGFLLSFVWNKNAARVIGFTTVAPSSMDLGNFDVDFPTFADNFLSLTLVGVLMAIVTVIHVFAVVKPDHAKKHVARYFLFCSLLGVAAVINFAFALLFVNHDLSETSDVFGRVLTTLQDFTIPMWISFGLWTFGGFASCDLLIWGYGSSSLSSCFVAGIAICQAVWMVLAARQWSLPECLNVALPNSTISVAFGISSLSLMLLLVGNCSLRPNERSKQMKPVNKTPSWLITYDPRSPMPRPAPVGHIVQASNYRDHNTQFSV